MGKTDPEREKGNGMNKRPREGRCERKIDLRGETERERESVCLTE